jgi:hypothetical protein
MVLRLPLQGFPRVTFLGVRKRYTMPRCKKPVTHNTTDTFDIPPDFVKGVTQTTITSCPSCGKEGEGDIKETALCYSFCDPLDLAFTIQDPCGDAAITLAREVLTLITNREDDSICQALIHEIQALNLKYRR